MNRTSILVAATAITLTAAIAMAQELPGGTSGTEIVKTGTYRPLTWYRIFKLGSAPYVNPDLLRNSKVVYQHAVSDLKHDVDMGALKRAVATGTIAIGQWDAKSEAYVVVSTAEIAPNLEGAVEMVVRESPGPGTALSSPKKWVLVGNEPTLFGKHTDGKLVTFNAGGLVNRD